MFYKTLHRILVLSLLLMFTSTAFANGRINGKVIDETGQPVASSAVMLANTMFGSAANLDGEYFINNIPAGTYNIRVSHVGYITEFKEISVSENSNQTVNFILKTDPVALRSVIIESERERSHVKLNTPVRTEVISGSDLTLNSNDGSLLTALSGRTGINTRPCALCGSASIGLQGLDPNYTEVSIDGMPMMSGLGALYGMYGISASDVTRVDLSKGSASSAHGAGAMAGAVNITTQSAMEQNSVQLRLTGSQTAHHAIHATLNESVMQQPIRFTVGYQSEPNLGDANNDGLTDQPQFSRYNLGLSSISSSENIGEINWGVRYYSERRFAGDVDWTKADRGSSTIYGREIFTDRKEFTTRYNSPHTGWGDWAYELGAVEHNQESWYGSTEFNATQRKIYNRLSLGRGWNGANSTVGQLVYSYDEYNDNLELEAPTDRTDRIPGLVLLHNWTPSYIFNAELGMRFEHYFDDGWVPTVRGAAFYRYDEKMGFRLSGGTGFRPITLFSLDKAVHAGFDHIELSNELKSERTANLGLSYIFEYIGNGYAVQADVTTMYTKFWNMATVTYDPNHIGTIHYANADDGYSQTLEMQISVPLSNGWMFGGGYTYTEAKSLFDDKWKWVELQNIYTSNVMASYTWSELDLTVGSRTMLYGPQKLPEGRDKEESPIYSITDVNIEKKFHNVNVSLSINNIGDWIQPDNPFVLDGINDNRIIDSAMIYGPMVGRTVMANLTWNLQVHLH